MFRYARFFIGPVFFTGVSLLMVLGIAFLMMMMGLLLVRKSSPALGNPELLLCYRYSVIILDFVVQTAIFTQIDYKVTCL